MVSLRSTPAPVCLRNRDRIIPSVLNLSMSVTWQLIVSPWDISCTFNLVCFPSSCCLALFHLPVPVGTTADKLCPTCSLSGVVSAAACPSFTFRGWEWVSWASPHWLDCFGATSGFPGQPGGKERTQRELRSLSWPQPLASVTLGAFLNLLPVNWV